MPNPIMKKINIAATVHQAIDYAFSNPCCICSCEGICGIKYKGTCKVARGIRKALLNAKKTEI